MGYRNLTTLKRGFETSIRKNKQIASDAHVWETAHFGVGVPRFTISHKSALVEFSFIKGFVSWEVFLEESFLLFLLGKAPPKGRGPARLVKPSTRPIADRIVREGKRFVDWATVDTVIKRASRFFRDGRPYVSMQSRSQVFLDMKRVRNTIVHSSASSRLSFQKLVRQELKSQPRNYSAGRFLDTTVPSSSYIFGLLPNSILPASYLDAYFYFISEAASDIVKS